jgi:peptide deformylase
MIKKIVTYPDQRIKITSADVRTFDEELLELIENMKDTMEANGLNELAAIQIAVPANVILLKDAQGEILELINPRIIQSEGTVESTEKTGYLPGITATLPRYGKIKLVYQDRSGTQKSMDVDGDLSIRIQRKIDYTFGGTFVDKLDKKGRKRVEKELETQWGAVQGESCPTVFYRDYFTKGIRYLLFIVFLTLFSGIFTDDAAILEKVYLFEEIATLLILLLIIGYFFYAQYEARTYRSCTSCQTGNIIGTVFIALVKMLLLFAAAYLFVNPA